VTTILVAGGVGALVGFLFGVLTSEIANRRLQRKLDEVKAMLESVQRSEHGLKIKLRSKGRTDPCR
jgi:hypothetical protein